MLLQKALLSERVNRRDVMLALARAYEAGGDGSRADAMMNALAPVGTAGHPAAHRYLAVRIADNAARTSRIDNLRAWHWHLSHADRGKSTALEKAWGMYYLVCGDQQEAVNHFRIAADAEPALWLQVAELEARLNDLVAAHRSLATAQKQLGDQFARDPGNSQNRLLYATSLFYAGQLPEAEMLLKQGLLEEDNAAFRKLLAAVFIRMYDAAMDTGRSTEDSFPFLRLSLEYDANFQPALTRLVAFARSGPERLDEARREMRALISGGKLSAMAHFTLGTLEWIDGNAELAELNMRQAIALDSRMPVLANNLAFLIAQSEDGDLGTALNLANQAVESAPGDAAFLDTRALLLEKLGRTADAAVDYQRALESAPHSTVLQNKLAGVYERLGDSQLAAHYRQAAEQAPTPRAAR